MALDMKWSFVSIPLLWCVLLESEICMLDLIDLDEIVNKRQMDG